MQEESKNTAGSETVEELTQDLREKLHRESYKAPRKNSKQFEDSLIKTACSEEQKTDSSLLTDNCLTNDSVACHQFDNH